MNIFDPKQPFGQPANQTEVGDIQMVDDFSIYDALRQSQTTSFLSPQAASDIAQNDSGLGIQNVKRGFAYAKAPMPSVVYTALGLNGWKAFPGMTLKLQLSGRPVMVFIKGVLQLMTSPPSLAAFEAQVEARIDDNASGFIVPCWTQVPSSGDASTRPHMPFSAFGIAVPTAGTHTFTMWASSTTNNVQINPTSYPYSMAVVEI